MPKYYGQRLRLLLCFDGENIAVVQFLVSNEPCYGPGGYLPPHQRGSWGSIQGPFMCPLEQIFLLALWLSIVSTFPPMFQIHTLFVYYRHHIILGNDVVKQNTSLSVSVQYKESFPFSQLNSCLRNFLENLTVRLLVEISPTLVEQGSCMCTRKPLITFYQCSYFQ
jgi:hypothetical protein